MKCIHKEVGCLNHYEIFRKYRCGNCSGVFICECERELSLKFLPHQIRYGREYETQKRVLVTGFAPNICAECKGLEEQEHPKAAIVKLKGKIERFYWREITKTYFAHVLNWIAVENIEVKDIIEFTQRYPGKDRELKKEAKRYWQDFHKKNPKYNLKERTEAELLSFVEIPKREIQAKYEQLSKGDQRIGRWIDTDGNSCSGEEIAAKWYESKGYSVKFCERKLISAWVATFLAPIIQDPQDPLLRLTMRQSTIRWASTERNTPFVEFWLPEDFASKNYYNRRRIEFDGWFEKLAEKVSLLDAFDSLTNESHLLRDYLWANDERTVELARFVLQVVPSKTVLNALRWAIEDFWNRQPGWPDLFATKDSDYLFVEVKTPHDKLSQSQMNWFQWAVQQKNISCEICRIRKLKS